MDTIFFSLLLNIGLLVLIATLLTKFSAVRQLFLGEEHTLSGQTVLALIFALVSILSTYTGIRTNGAIVNTRVIGVLTAGLLGGPYVGIGAAVIAAAHRYLFDIGGFTAFSCMMSTLFEGLIGAFFSARYRRGEIKLSGVFVITLFAEMSQMLIILLLAKPFAEALAVVKIIAMPMIVMNAVGMVIFITTFNRVFMEEDSEFAGKMRLAFDIAEKCLPYLRKGLYSNDIRETVKIIYDNFSCTRVMITDRERVLACYPGSQEILPPLKEAGSSRKVEIYTECEREDPLYEQLRKHTMIAAPLMEGDETIGRLVMVVKRKPHLPQATISFIEELAKLFSRQLALSSLEYQKALRRRAELEALQSQVNPHFLYNALNTIACVCRENPEQARELIQTLSAYYRQTLENDRHMVNLQTELVHVNSYLQLEKARFEEKLTVDIAVDEDVDCMVPAFILQPLVENAVKHGVDANGNRYVGIIANQEADGVRILVRDHGKGFPAEAVAGESGWEPIQGIGLKNVHKRLISMFREKSGLHLANTEAGGEVSFRIPIAGQQEVMR